MSDQPNVSTGKPSEQHVRDTYRVAYWYAWQGYEGHPDRHELAMHEADEAVDYLERACDEPHEPPDAPLVH